MLRLKTRCVASQATLKAPTDESQEPDFDGPGLAMTTHVLQSLTTHVLQSLTTHVLQSLTVDVARW